MVQDSEWRGAGDMAISIEHVSRSYRLGAAEVAALRDVSLKIGQGELVAITGRSGSGKSTLLNLISGIDRPTGGRIEVNGTDLGGLSESRLSQFRGSHVGIVFQFFELIPTLTALENVLLPMDLVGRVPRAERRRRATLLLDQVGLSGHEQKLPSRLSGGEQQRVAVARALANDPPVLVADEPCGNLDADNSARVMAIFRRCAAEGRAVVVATHERMDEPCYQRVLHLEEGRLAAQAAPA